MSRISYINGHYVPHRQASISVDDRGFLFSDSVYEVIAYINGKFADECGHLDRLERSLRELRIAMPMSRKALQMICRELIRRNRIKNGFAYIQITRGSAPRDFKFPQNVAPNVFVATRPANFDLEKRKTLLRKAKTVTDIRWARRDIKSTSLLAQVLAKQSAVDSGAYEALMVDPQGFITEGASSNLWIVDKDGDLVTRSLDNNMILSGITRKAIEAISKKENIKVIERNITIEELYNAQEAFTTAAVTLIVPIVEVDGKQIGNGKLGSVTEKLMDLYMLYAAEKSAISSV